MAWLGFDHWPELFRPPLDEVLFGKLNLNRGLLLLAAIVVVCDVAVVLISAAVS